MTPRKREFKHGTKTSRLRQARERLGGTEKKCLLCAVDHPHSLQLHHVAGREFADDEAAICCNHHARLSDAFKDHPQKIPDCSNQLENSGHLLLGFAECVLIALEDLGGHPNRELLVYLEAKLRAFGLCLIELARSNPGGGS